MQGQLQARLVALKAFLIGRQTPPPERQAAKEKAKSAIARLNLRTDPESIRRLSFYSLVLSELERDGDYISYRDLAITAGQKLLLLEIADPFPVYMKIVEATTSALTTADFGDFKSSPSWSHSSSSVSPVTRNAMNESSFAVAYEAAELHDYLPDELRAFLENASLESIMKSHGLLN
jgi:hypothetical protein